MTKISAQIVADSKDDRGNRITTMVVTFPRFILAELNTHRMFSRNSASSRAIPFAKMLESVKNNPFIPIAWQKEHKGMQGSEYLTGDEAKIAELRWLQANVDAVHRSQMLNLAGVTKQLCNRLLEPFMWHTVIVTATEWENMFALRCPRYTSDKEEVFRSRKDFIKAKDNKEEGFHYPVSDLGWRNIDKGQSEIHMMALAEAMWDAYQEGAPNQLKPGEWHIPFGDKFDKDRVAELYYEVINNDRSYDHISSIEETKVKIATARCARVSYTVVGEEGKAPNYENDVKLHDTLATSGHWSPFEHCAKVMTDEEYDNHISGVGYDDHGGTFSSGQIFDETSKGWSGNYRGFVQYRKTFKNENIK